MTSLLTHVHRYLIHRRRLGFVLGREQLLLPKLARFHAAAAPGRPLQVAVILRWAVQPGTGNRSYYVKRLAMARSFARYCAALDPRVQVPDCRLLGDGYRRKAPHLYSSAEIRWLLRRARELPTYRSPLRPLTYETLLGLIACTGLRIREAMRLQLDDVDFARGTLHVARAKFSPDRLLPLHPSTLAALSRCHEARCRKHPIGGYFFLGRAGRPLECSGVHKTFRDLAQGLAANGAHPLPRIHDLRHTFASRHVARWSREAAPVMHRLLLLSRYLGHRQLRDTWWYVTTDADSLRVAAQRFERFEGIP